MIVIGTDTHKQIHTAAAVFAGSGQLAEVLTAPAREPGFREFLTWARDIDAERIWALEDCRHVSGSFERFLRCLKRHLARRVWRLLVSSEIDRSMTTVDTQRGSLSPQFAVAA